MHTSSKQPRLDRFAHLPSEMVERPQWVAWKQASKTGSTKPSKIPVNPKTRKNASATRHEDWGTFAQALAACAQDPNLKGLGFVFTPVDPFLGIDLDQCLEPDTLEPFPWAQEIIRKCASYTEISPGGTGIHIIVRGSLPPGGNRCGPVEMYEAKRFFTMTGKRINGTPSEIRECQEAVDAIHAQHIVNARNKDPNLPIGTDHSSANDEVPALSDEEVLHHARSASNRDKFNALWQGRIDDYTSESEATLALLNFLAYHSHCNREQMDRLFRQSELMRDKWDESRGETTWGAQQVEKAIKDTKPLLPANDNDHRPIIRCDQGEMHRIVEEAEMALKDADLVFQQNGRLVRVVRLPVGGTDATNNAALSIQDVDPNWLGMELARVARWEKFIGTSKSYRSTDVPVDVSKAVLANAGNWPFPHLEAVIEAPTIRPDGSLLNRPGYDPKTGLYFDPNGTEFPPIPSNPTKADAEHALVVLKEVLEEFPFVDDHHRSVGLSAILTVLVRRSLRSAPMFGISAPKMGSGKSLLADVITMIGTGHSAQVMSQVTNPEDERKRIFSLLLNGDAVAVIDNVEKPIESDALCSVLTEANFLDRVLGKSETRKAPCLTTWIATGNNLRFKGDISTRVLICRFDARVERPEEREFKKDLRVWIKEYRPKLVQAGLTILRAYVEAGKPRLEIKPFGRFEAWSDMVRSPLIWLGEPDPCATRIEAEASDPVREHLVVLLIAWHNTFEGKAMTCKEVLHERDLSIKSNLAEAIAQLPLNPHIDTARALGDFLSKHKERIEDGMWFKGAGKRGGVALWCVGRSEAQPSASA
ncbi:MAG: hypothetical protein HQL97_12925 [Magnetococcales bacterium]|nr:hypothetical protein [Magnetococcales bacterium]